MKPHCFETPKYRHLVLEYLTGNGVDIGSGGCSVVSWAIQVELSHAAFEQYNQRPVPGNVEWIGDCFELPFKDGVLDWVYSSHVIEDFNRITEWPPLFTEWTRVLKPGGYMVLIVPEVERWAKAIANGQCPNCSHWAPEPSLGDMSRYALQAGLVVISERFTDTTPDDYSILGVFRKPLP